MAKISGTGSIPIVMNNLQSQVTVIKHFKESKMITFDFTNSFDMSDVLSKVLAENKADAVTNVKMTIKMDPPAFFLNLVTLGIANAQVMEIEGDLVKYKNNSMGSIETLNDIKVVVNQNSTDEAGVIDAYSALTIVQGNNGLKVAK
jgi:uncharacterized membrane protein